MGLHQRLKHRLFAERRHVSALCKKFVPTPCATSSLCLAPSACEVSGNGGAKYWPSGPQSKCTGGLSLVMSDIRRSVGVDYSLVTPELWSECLVRTGVVPTLLHSTYIKLDQPAALASLPTPLWEKSPPNGVSQRYVGTRPGVIDIVLRPNYAQITPTLQHRYCAYVHKLSLYRIYKHTYSAHIQCALTEYDGTSHQEAKIDL